MVTGAAAVRAPDLLRQVAAENDLRIILGKVARDDMQPFLNYRAHQSISKILRWFKCANSRFFLQEFPHLKRQLWRRHFWLRGYVSITSGMITDEISNEYINEQEGKPVEDDGRCQIDPS
jgi:putative transposase